MPHKKKTHCREGHPLSDDNLKVDGRGYKYRHCPICDAKRYRVRTEKLKGKRDPNIWRRWFLKAKFGISLEQFDEMFLAQGKRCAICKSDKSFDNMRRRFHIDHDHITGQIRAILCGHCNVALAMAQDDPALLRLMADYLDLHHGKRG